MISFLETLRTGDMSKERLRRSQNKFQNVRKGRSSSNEYSFSGGTLVYQTVPAGPYSTLSARGSVTLRLLLEKRKNWDPPKKKSQQWTKLVKRSLKKTHSGVDGKIIIEGHQRASMTHCLMISSSITEDLRGSLELLRANSMPRI